MMKSWSLRNTPDEQKNDRIINLIQNPEKLEQFTNQLILALVGLQKSTGVQISSQSDTRKEAAHWAGFVHQSKEGLPKELDPRSQVTKLLKTVMPRRRL